MAKVWSLTEAFRHLGAELKNARQNWPARTADGQAVVLALWADRFDFKQTPPVYDGTSTGSGMEWIKRRGNLRRRQDLVWARDNCEGRFRVVMIRAKDATASPREIADCFPKDGWVMEVTDLDADTGQFHAKMVSAG